MKVEETFGQIIVSSRDPNILLETGEEPIHQKSVSHKKQKDNSSHGE
jgi:hypothetical protein